MHPPGFQGDVDVAGILYVMDVATGILCDIGRKSITPTYVVTGESVDPESDARRC